ncbi:MAG TPA: cation:proton antiporter, partial [Patescibacteria group bacterium]|nr:cation:proton antiporter [Patescibacteria group bacterium]
MNIFLFLSLVFLLTFAIGRLIEKIRVPWLFAALLVGGFLAAYNPFTEITESQTFEFLAQMGMYFLLFIIGFEINLKQLKGKGKFIVRSAFFIIFLEAILGSLLIHFLFDYSWFISGVVALSFATVGEAILVPVLDEFKILNTNLGQSIIGIGTLDDVIEIFILILVIITVGIQQQDGLNIIAVITIVSSLLLLFLLTVVLTKLRKENSKFHFSKIETLFLFVLFVLCLFLGIGEYAHAAPLAALLAGVGLRTFIPPERLDMVETEVKTMCYGFFAPIFFLWAGATMDMDYLIAAPLLVLAVIIVTKSAKFLGSFITARKELGTKQSLLLGLGLSARFSTSIVIIKILYENGLIEA